MESTMQAVELGRIDGNAAISRSPSAAVAALNARISAGTLDAVDGLPAAEFDAWASAYKRAFMFTSEDPANVCSCGNLKARGLCVLGWRCPDTGRLTVSRKAIENAVYAALVSGVPADIDHLAPAIWQELRAKAELAGMR